MKELTKIGARMMLQSAVEEEVKAYLQRDYYERNAEAKGSRSGSKPGTVKIGSGDIGIKMPQVKKAIGKLIDKKGLSHQNVIKISSRIVDEFHAWKKRDLTMLQVVYLVLTECVWQGPAQRRKRRCWWPGRFWRTAAGSLWVYPLAAVNCTAHGRDFWRISQRGA